MKIIKKFNIRIILFFIALVWTLPNICYAKDFTLKWDANKESNIDHYVIYWRVSTGEISNRSGAIDKKHTSYTVSGLDDGPIYCFTIKAFTTLGEASDFSKEACTVELIPPLVSLSASPVSGKEPLIVNFSVKASDKDGTISKYEWDLDGDGTFELKEDNLSHVAHEYNKAGAYNVKVKVTDNHGAFTDKSIMISVKAVLSVKLRASLVLGTAPIRIVFSAEPGDNTGKIIRFLWDLDGDGTFLRDTGKISSTAYTYNRKGKYDAGVKVISSNGTSNATVLITVE